MNKRSSHTIYTSHSSEIFEYKNEYYVLQMCQQGQILNPLHGSGQSPSEFACVSSRLPTKVSSSDLGDEVYKALNNFDTIGPEFCKFDETARNKTISSWFKARGMMSLLKNIRVVKITNYLDNDLFAIIPFDNFNRNYWNGPMEDKRFEMKKPSPELLGATIKKAFSLATYHPERKDPI